MLRLTRCTRTGERPSSEGRSPRPAHHQRGGAPRRLLAGLVVAAAGVAGTTAGASTAALATWTGTAQASTTLSMATIGQNWVNLNTAGTIRPDGVYEIRGLVTENIGYIDLVNGSTTAVTLSVIIASSTLVGASPAQICSGAWNRTTGDCNGTVTTPPYAAVLGGASGTHATPVPIAPNGRVSFKVRLTGLANAVTLTPRPAAPRPATDRTAS